MRKKLLYTLGASLICLLGIVSVSMAIFPEQTYGAFSKYGLPGIYNSTDFTLTDGQGSAIAVDSTGAVMLSPSSSLSTLTVGDLQATSATIGTLDVTVAGSALETLDVYNAGHTATTSIGTATSTFSGEVIIGDDLTVTEDALFDGTMSNGGVSSVYFTGDAGSLLGSGFNLDATAALGGADLVFISTAQNAAAGAGGFAIFNRTAGKYLLVTNASRQFFVNTDEFLTPANNGAFNVGGDSDDGSDYVFVGRNGSDENVYLVDTAGDITQNSLNRRAFATSTADEGYIDLPTSTSGWGHAMIGDNQEYAYFSWQTDGTVTLDIATANTVATDTDAKFCIFDNGTGVRIKNRLGSTLTIKSEFNY